MGTSLLSCSDRNGEKQRIDRVEIVDDSNPVDNVVIGLPLPPDSLDPGKKETLPPTIDGVKAPTATGKNKPASKKSNTPIILTGAVIISEKDSLKKKKNKNPILIM